MLGPFFLGEWCNEVNDKDRYTSIVDNTVVLDAFVFLLLPVALHGEDLHETNAGRRPSKPINAEHIQAQDLQDVDHIEFESDRLPDWVPGDNTCFGHTSVVQYFLSASGWV